MLSRSLHPRAAGFARAAAVVAAALLVALVAPAAARATCYSSTSSSQAFPDSAFDGESGLAPEILGVVAVTDSRCGIGVDSVIQGDTDPGDLIDGEAVGIYIDTDGNPSTGSPTFDGADRVVMIVGQLGSDVGPALGVWDGSQFSFDNAPLLTAVGAAGFVTDIDQLGVPRPATLGIRAVSLYEGIYDVYMDAAPEPGQLPFAFPVSFSTAAPPPCLLYQ
ncbi:MAG: hypothetical protein IRZ21_11150, partial [Thermoleophilaceae bacterium]|nr:hypothetical protein [Thermoleophilaceae bacterium]